MDSSEHNVLGFLSLVVPSRYLKLHATIHFFLPKAHEPLPVSQGPSNPFQSICRVFV